ncbi:MAG: hypothetical protein V4620_03835 [Bacteroidota bacterium]
MSNSEIKPQELYFQEVIRQVSSHSTIIAGFAFAGLTVDIDHGSDFAKNGFTICLAFAMGLEILALSVSGFLLSALKLNSITNKKWKTHYYTTWWSYLMGLWFFLFSLPFLVYFKIPYLVIPAIIFTLTLLYLISKNLTSIIKKSNV